MHVHAFVRACVVARLGYDPGIHDPRDGRLRKPAVLEHLEHEPVVLHLRVELGHGRLDIFAFTINVADTLPQVLRQHDDPKSKPRIQHYREHRIDAVCSVGDSQRLLILLPRRAHQSG